MCNQTKVLQVQIKKKLLLKERTVTAFEIDKVNDIQIKETEKKKLTAFKVEKENDILPAK